jgi:4-hydroxy-2-oxoheptanedioate aldolase
VRDFAERLRAGEALISGWSTLPDPLIAGVIARGGFDVVSFDAQHGLHDISSIIDCAGVLSAAGKPAVVRVPVGDMAMASRVLDVGAVGVIAPMVNTPEEARALVAATKYPPVGERSWGPVRAMALSGRSPAEHLAFSNDGTIAFAMIETERALAALDEILAVEGLDGVFVGPSDLSLTLSKGEQIDPLSTIVDGPVRTIAQKARAAGKIAGVYAGAAERAQFFLDAGYTFIVLGIDTGYVAEGVRAILAPLKRGGSAAS